MLDKSIDAHGCAMNHKFGLLQIHPSLLDACQDRFGQIMRRSQRLSVDYLASKFVERDQVSKCAANVNSDPECHQNVPVTANGFSITGWILVKQKPIVK
jgi:hypothetical protein